jgi:hypothetical protein
MTTKQTAKLQALREEADVHGDAATVALIDTALAGDIEAARKLGVVAKAIRAASAGAAAKAPRARRSPFAASTRDIVHPWAQDEE